DRFHGPSLRRFPRETPILIPRSGCDRLRRDLAAMGFTRIRELSHGRSVVLARGFTLTAYQVHPFTESAVVVECEDTVLFNANDAKLLGAPLAQILKRHPRMDFLFRAHG